MMIKFKIPGEPQGKGRARVTKFGTYTPEKTQNYEAFIKIIAKESTKEFYQNEPLMINISAYYAIPKSVSKKKRMEMQIMKINPTKKPDLDNIVKVVCDALNGICYRDDSQIVSVVANKYYAEIPSVQVLIDVV
jgi:Holliday junction resolvase RusA-like endonuclease